MQINKNISSYNFNAGTLARIKYLVIHFTANNGDTAHNNTKYFQTYRGSSAHYFVDENSIWQSVEDQNIAWHCGANSYKHPECRNTNSIGIELCSRIANGKYYFKDETVNNAIELARYLMKKYNIPVSKVVRHYDVTGKNCPAPYVNDAAAWNNFLKRLEEEEVTQEKFEEMSKTYENKTNKFYANVSDLPSYFQGDIKALVANGIITGDGTNELGMRHNDVRTLVIVSRMLKSK